MKIIFLGTGTSVGVPAIGCDCAVCTSGNPRNRRYRASLYVEAGGKCFVVDTTPDFRSQVLACGIRRVDAVLLTHSHADHILGFDDIRRFNTLQRCIIPVYGLPETIADMNKIFGYVHVEHVPGVFRPQVEFHEISKPFQIDTVTILPVRVAHGNYPTCGFRLDAGGQSLGYFPDCHELDEQSIRQLRGLDVMIIDSLRKKPHNTHLSLDRALDLLARINAKKSFVIHMCHDLEHQATQVSLPDSMFVAYDGMTLKW